MSTSKSISTKAKNDQGKSYSDRTNRQTNRVTNKQTIEFYNIDYHQFSIYPHDVV